MVHQAVDRGGGGHRVLPDPLTIHGLAGDPNPYAAMRGSPIGNADAFGLDVPGGTETVTVTSTPFYSVDDGEAVAAALNAAIANFDWSPPAAIAFPDRNALTLEEELAQQEADQAELLRSIANSIDSGATYNEPSGAYSRWNPYTDDPLVAAMFGASGAQVNDALARAIAPAIEFLAPIAMTVVSVALPELGAVVGVLQAIDPGASGTDRALGMAAVLPFAGGLGRLAKSVRFAEGVDGAVARGGTYVLKDGENIVRCGRTCDLLRRMGEHGRDPALKDYTFEVVHRTDVYDEQRGLEQMLHDAYHPPLDKIRPINPSNTRKAERYLRAAQQFLNAK